MTIYKNDPKYKILFMSKNDQLLQVLYRLELSKQHEQQKHKNTLFGNS